MTTAVAAPPIASVQGLDAWIGTQQILHGVRFEVPGSGVTALLGRNGVGKTTTLRALLGLVRRSGTIQLAGTRIDRLATHQVVRAGVGYVPENREVFGSLTVAQNLTLARRDGSHEDAVRDLFPDLVARAAQPAGTLSGGQQQMVALARALLNGNRLLLVDEPTKGLAPKLVDEVAGALRAAAERLPILLVEQNLAVVRHLADHAVVMAEGRVVHTGPADELLDDSETVQELLGVSGGHR